MHRHGPSCLPGPVSRNRFQHLPSLSSDDPSSDIRWELVERIRREIAEGTYDTPEKWEAALERMLDRLDER